MSFVALDIGGTNVRYTYTKESGTDVFKYYKKPFEKTGDPYTEVEKNICGIIETVSDSLSGIGISLAAVMERRSGKVKIWPNNPCWNQYELVQHLNDKYKIPVVINDDANCGAVAEYSLQHNCTDNMVYITIGTGIGCGLILNRLLFTGENGFAGEIGHILLDSKSTAALCTCGNRGCLQAIASGPSVVNMYNMTSKNKLGSLEQVYSQYLIGDTVAVTCFWNMAKSLSKAIYNLAMCLDISIFVLGGGIGSLDTNFTDQIDGMVNKRLSRFGRSATVTQSKFGEYSGVYGAWRLLYNHIYKK